MREIGIIATVHVPHEQQLLRVVKALVDGGIRAVELAYSTIRSAGWLIQSLKESGLLIGVGAVTRSAQAHEAGVLGADFITASVTTPDVVSACEEMKIPCILSGRSLGRAALHPFPTRDATSPSAGRRRHAPGWLYSLPRGGCRGA